MPKHIKVLIMLLGALALAFIGGKWFFTPPSFWAYGHYRAASVREIAEAASNYQDPSTFSAAYPQVYAAWSANIHKAVKCQDCHFAAEDQQASNALPIAHDSLSLCPVCHARIVGRPSSMPQVDVASHAQGKQCTSCHNPHSPLFSPDGKPIAVAGASTANIGAGQALSARCIGCHGAQGVSAVPTFPNLACQKESYLVAALDAYQTGARSNPVMAGVAKSLTKSDALNVAGYFASLPCGK